MRLRRTGRSYFREAEFVLEIADQRGPRQVRLEIGLLSFVGRPDPTLPHPNAEAALR